MNERHGWMKPGDAWGYRRQAYRWGGYALPEFLNEVALQRNQYLKWFFGLRTGVGQYAGQWRRCLGGKALECYESVFAHETEQTKHISQDFTPKLAAPVVPKIYVQ